MSEGDPFNESADGPPDPKRLELPLIRLDPRASAEEKFTYMVDRLFEITENLRYLRAETQGRIATAREICAFDDRLSALEHAFAEFRAQFPKPS